jgi:hypothetical protein
MEEEVEKPHSHAQHHIRILGLVNTSIITRRRFQQGGFNPLSMPGVGVIGCEWMIILGGA